MSSSSFKRSTELQVPNPSTSYLTLELEGANDDVREARFWAQHFNLGRHNNSGIHKISWKKKKNGYPKSVQFVGPSQNAIIQQLVFGPPAFGSSPPLAVASGPRVGLYGTSSSAGSKLGRALGKKSSSTTTEEEENNTNITYDRQIGTGGHPVFCVSYRNDGRLLAVGTDGGYVRVSDATSRATLATFETDSKLTVRSVQWLRNGKQIVSAGDDGVVRLWNLDCLKKNKATKKWIGHGDSVRSLLVWQPRSAGKQQQRDVVVSGSYDHTIRVWNLSNDDEDDEQQQQEYACLGIMNHGAPVMALLFMKNHNKSNTTNMPYLLSAGGTQLKVWNFLSGQCLSTIETKHSKTITSMASMTRRTTANDEKKDSIVLQRILTAGLDGMIRIHAWSPPTNNNTSSFLKHIHGIKLQEPITSIAIDQTCLRLVIGTTKGTVFYRQQQQPTSEQSSTKRKLTSSSGELILSGSANIVVGDTNRKRYKKCQSFDKALKQFRYGDALDEALNTKNPDSVLAVLEELGRRDRGLSIALSNRDEESLEPLLSFLERTLCRSSKKSSVLIGVLNLLCDMYFADGGGTPLLEDLLGRIRGSIREEIASQKGLLRIAGMLDALLVIQQQQHRE
eukprot:CAMPEP_0194179648 /NCGR_PEP_ID=MMETSP0154-20130528/13058_1 /TAXON_ID=1049557 /ORGANISM="Thalassiothrix antarctica, Strain L6-D1" /LENGTH=618 /DNA_ID=CAMNT_0038895067 /DNA_START=111 /DNA_END=1967 /DNA_ORIENTATION=+